jgi:hypothetical protein
MPLRSTRSIPTAAPPEPAGVYPVGLLATVSLVMLVTASLASLLGWELSPLTWYLARASGVTLYLLLWASTMLGLGLSTHLMDGMMRRGDVYSLHAYLTALALSFLGVHVLTLAADQYTAFTLADLLVPFHSGMREPWTGLGVIGGWLMVAISAATTAMELLYGITAALFLFLVLYRALRGRRNPELLIPKTAPPLDRMTARM